MLGQDTITNKYIFALTNNVSLSVEFYDTSIVRLRTSNTDVFNESLLERYGILNNPSKRLVAMAKNDGDIHTLETPGLRLEINTRERKIAIADLKNRKIKHINLSVDNEIETGLKQDFKELFNITLSPDHIVGDTALRKTKAAMTDVQPDPSLMAIQLNASERIYGGGNTSRLNIQHRGEALRMWATYQRTEIPVPFVMSTDGWGIFNNTTVLNYFDIGRFDKDKLYIYNTDGDLDFFLLMGNSMTQVLERYTTLTGKSYVMPKWAYGLAFGGNTMENQLNIMNDAIKFREEKIPCDILWLEPQWMAKNYDFSTSKNWNLERFPAEPFWEVNKTSKYEHHSLFVHKLHQSGFKLALWLCIDHDLSIAEEDLLAGKTGKPQSGQEHWFSHLTKFIDQGVDGFKLDPGRTLDEHPNRVYYNGLTDKEMHNLNQVLVSKQMYQTFRDHKKIRSFHHYCGGYAGSQHWGASTSGDNGGGKDALYDQLNLGMSGFINTSADVLEYVTDNKAGMHLGFFLPWVQINSWYSLHHPWYMPPDEKETFRYYAQLRNSLIPYIYSTVLQGRQTGMPVLRAMPLVFPDDPKAENLIYQYMFGDNLLVGVFSDSIYLPKGNWINYWSGETFTGSKTVHCIIPENRGGLIFIKGGAIIPMQKPMQYVGESAVDTLILKVYPDNQSSYTLFEDDGISFDYEKGSTASTKFTCDQNEGQIDFVICRTTGSYIGMPSNRVYELELAIKENPHSVLINGQVSNTWSYNRTNVIKLLVAENATGKDIRIVIK